MHKQTDKSMLITAIIVALTIWTALIVLRCIAHAQKYDAVTRLALQRCIVGEAGYHVPDWAPIAFVLERGWKKKRHVYPTFKRFIHGYSVPLKGWSDRSIRVLSLPTIQDNKLYNAAKWAELGAWIDRWMAGEVRDPCPRATDWNCIGCPNKRDIKVKPVNCGRTKNVFYRRVR